MLANMMGMPISSEMTWAISSLRAARPSAMAWMYLPRSSLEVWPHVLKAALAAATALSTSSAVPAGTEAMISSVEGFSTSMVSVPVDGTHAPSM